MGIIWEWHEDLGGSLGGGGSAPYFTCDTCGKKLDNGLGKIVWETVDTPDEDAPFKSTGKYWILGKGDEHRACDLGESRKHSWEDLDEFLLMAAHNSKFDLQQTKEQVEERREKFGF
ncbi:MAG: hypothetical protein ACR2NB_14655 [Solirubrobacteraceae bacterium]